MRVLWYFLVSMFFSAFLYWIYSTFRRKKNNRDDSNTEGRIALSDDSWIDEIKKMNPRGNGD